MATIQTFGPFRLDADSGVLFRGDAPVALGQRAIALLRLLIERAGTPVSKGALIEAAWPGIAVEESNLTVQIAALRRAFAEEAGGQGWIETMPRRGYRFVGPAVTGGDGAASTINPDAIVSPKSETPLALPDMPSIAVLPFQNISADAEQDYFADGIVEEIITALSRFRHLFVIARNSSFTYKGRATDVKQIGRELGVRYVLEGSIRKASNQVRMAGQLIDATTGVQLWADRFDGTLEDIFELQDRMSASVVGAIAPKLEQAEISRARRKPTESLDAYDFYLRGIASGHLWTRASNEDALRLFSKTIELDPQFAAAYGLAAFCHVRRKLNRWSLDRAQDVSEGARLARSAVDLGKDDAVALSWGGHALGYLAGDFDSALVFVDRARSLNPNLPSAWSLGGWVRTFRGELDQAIGLFERAIRLSPLDPILFAIENGIGFVHFLAGRYDDASAWTEMALREQPNYFPAHCVAVASRALAGRTDDAQRAMARLSQLDPALRISDIADWYPLRRAEDLAKLTSGLRKGGLPD
jgi:TolB-like protein